MHSGGQLRRRYENLVSHPHEMYFLLDRADYDSIWPFLTNALWPYTAPHPGKAGDEYVRKLEALVRGELKFNVQSYDPILLPVRSAGSNSRPSSQLLVGSSWIHC